MLDSPLAPPSLYLLSAGGVLWLCHRHLRPLGRWIALALLLLPLCLTGRALLTGSAYAPFDSAYRAPPFDDAAAELGVEAGDQPILHDLYTMILPGQQAVRHAWSVGDWPLWNPFILCGQVLAGSGQPAPFYPPNLLSMLLSPALAPGYLATLHFFLAALGGFLLGRELGCRPRTAMFAAAGWMTVSFNVFWIGWPLGAALVWLPLIWLGVRRAVRRPGWRSCLLLASVLALSTLAGHPETSAHYLWVGGGLGLWELAARPRGEWLRILGWAAAAGALSAGLTAIFVLPLADALVQTFEWTARGVHQISVPTSWAESARRLFPNLVPVVEKFPPRRLDGAEKVYSSMHSAYAGSVLLAPAIYGLLRWRRPERWQLVAFGTLGLLAGIRLPLLYPLLDRLPLLDRSINDRLIALTGLALVLLAALGLEAWCERRPEEQKPEPEGLGRRLRPGWIAAVLLPAMIALALLSWRPLVEYGQRVGGQVEAGDLAVRIALWLVPAALALPLLLLRRGRPWALSVLLALLLAQRVAEVGGFYPISPPERFYPAVAPLDVEFPGDRIFRVAGAGATLIPAQGVYYGLEDVRGYDAVHHRRFLHLSEVWTADSRTRLRLLDELDHPLLSLANVRWALVRRGAQPPDGWRLARRGGTANLWRNPQVLERAFIPRRVRFVDQPRQILAQMQRQRDFSALAWIEPPGPPPPPHQRANGAGTVTLARDGLGYRLTATLESPAWVVISDVAWRGWRARSDGRELPLGVADYAFLALELPAGRHDVELFFRPRSFEAGLAITGTTLAGLLLTLVWYRLRRRRLG